MGHGTYTSLQDLMLKFKMVFKKNCNHVSDQGKYNRPNVCVCMQHCSVKSTLCSGLPLSYRNKKKLVRGPTCIYTSKCRVSDVFDKMFSFQLSFYINERIK